MVLAIYADAPQRVVFVERARHLRDHPGQIGLPGGSADPADGGDPAVTALRELHEEVGIDASRITLVGRLAQVHQRFNNFSVAPFVGVVQPGTKLTIDETETAAVFTVPLAAIVAPGAVHEGIERVGAGEIATYHFDYRDRHIWGLTGRMLFAFVTAWHANDPLRAALEARLER